MMGSATLAYVVILFTNNTLVSFVYAYLILIASMVYLNIRMVTIGNIVILVSNALKLALRYSSSDASDQSAMFVAVFVSALACFASIKIIKLLILNHKESTETIVEAAKKQEESNNTNKVPSP